METEQRTCSTCAQMYPVSDFPSKPVESQCTHEQDTCSQCWRHWLQVQVATKTFDRIQCAQCSTLLGQGEVKAFATQEIYQRCALTRLRTSQRTNSQCHISYLDSEVRAALSSDPNFYWCMSASCSHGQLHYDGDIFTCQACGHKTCMACTAPWHAGETCKDHQARMLEEQEEAEISIQTGRQAGVEVSDEKKELRKRRRMEEEAAAKTLSKVSKLCPGCTRKVQKHGYVFRML